MDVSIGEQWQDFVDDVVKSGRYGSASEVVRESLRLIAEREPKLAALRATLDASIERGGAHSPEQVAGAVASALDEWEHAAGR